MPIGLEQFWQLVESCELMSAKRVEQLRAQAPTGSATEAAQHLVTARQLSAFQARVLLAGKPRRFRFGSLLLWEPVIKGCLAGLWRAIEPQTKQTVLVDLIDTRAIDGKALCQYVDRLALAKHAALLQGERAIVAGDVCAIVVSPRWPAVMTLALAGDTAPSSAWASAVELRLGEALGAIHAQGLMYGPVLAECVLCEAATAASGAPGQPATTAANCDVSRIRLLGFPLNASLPRAQPFGSAVAVYQPSGSVELAAQRTRDALSASGGGVRKSADDRRELHTLLTRFAQATTGGLESNRTLGLEEQLQPIAALPEINLRASDETSAARARPRRSRRNVPLIVAAASGTIALLLAGAAWWRLNGTPADRPGAANQVATAAANANGNALAALPAQSGTPIAPGATETAATETAATVTAADTLADKEATAAAPATGAMWQSPTAGESLDLQWLPDGTDTILAVRPAALAASAEGERLLAALGAWGDWINHELPRAVGLPLAEIELATLSLLEPVADVPRIVAVCHTAKPVDTAQLGGDGEKLVRGGSDTAPLWVRGETGWLIPADADNRLVVWGPADELRALAERGPSSPAMPAEVSQLARLTDRERMLTVIFPGAQLLDDRRQLFAGDWSAVRAAVAPRFASAPRAIALSLQVDDSTFLELRMVGSAEVRPSETAKVLRDLIEGLASRARETAATRTGQYGSDLLKRSPQMAEMLAQFSRTAVEGRQVLWRAYLPAAAAQNLAWVARLAARDPEETSPAASTPDPANMLTARERLVLPASLSVPRATLSGALDLLAAELGLRFEILGRDLEAEGITQNQSFGIDLRDLPGEQILAEILTKASPDGKLAYVIRRETAGGEAIFLTTRAAATQRGETPLPAAPKAD